MKIITLFVLSVLLSACAPKNIDKITTEQSKIQCPVGYHLEQTAGVVIFAGSNDQNKHSVEFRCVADSNQENYNNLDASQY